MERNYVIPTQCVCSLVIKYFSKAVLRALACCAWGQHSPSLPTPALVTPPYSRYRRQEQYRP